MTEYGKQAPFGEIWLDTVNRLQDEKYRRVSMETQIMIYDVVTVCGV